jgi:hypothetical protein
LGTRATIALMAASTAAIPVQNATFAFNWLLLCRLARVAISANQEDSS